MPACLRSRSIFLPTPSARRATLLGVNLGQPSYISTHALREEGDRQRRADRRHPDNFYPRPPRGGRRGRRGPAAWRRNNFYPRPPRGGRRSALLFKDARQHISTHALREEGDSLPTRLLYHDCISTHALREEGDGTGILSVERTSDFYPRPPRGGRRLGFAGAAALGQISTHALREEGDAPSPTPSARPVNFYPRPPRGGRPIEAGSASCTAYFYPRPPRGGRQACPGRPCRCS